MRILELVKEVSVYMGDLGSTLESLKELKLNGEGGVGLTLLWILRGFTFGLVKLLKRFLGSIVKGLGRIERDLKETKEGVLANKAKLDSLLEQKKDQ